MNPFRFRKLKGVMMSKLLAMAVRKLAEGDFGAGPAKVYWWLAGKKTVTAVVLSGAAGALWLAGDAGVCDPCGGYAGAIATAAAVLVPIGLFDAAVRIEPPSRPLDTVATRRR